MDEEYHDVPLKAETVQARGECGAHVDVVP